MPDLTDAEWATYYFIISTIIIVNATEMAILLRKHKKLTNYEWLLLSLSVSDLFVGLSKVSLAIIPNELSSKIKNAGILSLWFSIACSVSHTFGITIDRLSAVAYPIKHRMWSTRRNVALTLIGAWSFGCLIFPINYIPGNTKIELYIAILIIITSFVLVFSYSYIIYKVTIKRRRLLSKSAALSLEQAIINKREINLACMCCAISLTFIAMMLPFAVNAINAINTIKKGGMSPTVYFPMIANSMTNPLLYFFWKYLDEKIKARKLKIQSSKSSGKDSTHKSGSYSSKIEDNQKDSKRNLTTPTGSMNSREINFVQQHESDQLKRSSINASSGVSFQATETEVVRMSGLSSVDSLQCPELEETQVQSFVEESAWKS